MGTQVITAITPEIRKELSVIFQQEIAIREQQKEDSRTAYRRVFKEFEMDMKRFDYATTKEIIAVEGGARSFTEEHVMHWKVKNAIGTLLRAIYQTSRVELIPADKETDMRDFVRRVLALMEEKASTDAALTASVD